MKVLIFAHFDKFGVIRDDIITFIEKAQLEYDKIYFISTQANKDELEKINSSVAVIVRENIGYDFFSYRAGIMDFLKSKHDDINNGFITLMNSSFVIVDPEKFIANIRNTFQGEDCVTGITKSIEIKPHVQSYLVTIPLKLFETEEFMKWWEHMTPINDRNQVILKYEIGLSEKLLELGFQILSTFEPRFSLRRFKIKNPCFSQPERMLEEVGIVKVQLLRDNPHNQSLKKILSHFNKSDHARDLYEQAVRK